MKILGMTKTCQFFFKEMNYLALKLKQVKDMQNNVNLLGKRKRKQPNIKGLPLKPIPPYFISFTLPSPKQRLYHLGLNHLGSRPFKG